MNLHSSANFGDWTIRSVTLELVRRAPGSAVVPRDVAVVIRRYRTALRVVVIGAALLILIALNAPSSRTVLFAAIVVLVLLAATELLGRVPLEGSPAGSVRPSTEPVASGSPAPAVQVRTRTTRRPTAKIRLPSESQSRHSDSFYERFAAVYATLMDSGTAAPAKTIAKANSVPVTTVHGWAREARRRGYLAPGRRTAAPSTRR